MSGEPWHFIENAGPKTSPWTKRYASEDMRIDWEFSLTNREWLTLVDTPKFKARVHNGYFGTKTLHVYIHEDLVG